MTTATINISYFDGKQTIDIPELNASTPSTVKQWKQRTFSVQSVANVNANTVSRSDASTSSMKPAMTPHMKHRLKNSATDTPPRPQGRDIN